MGYIKGGKSLNLQAKCKELSLLATSVEYDSFLGAPYGNIPALCESFVK